MAPHERDRLGQVLVILIIPSLALCRPCLGHSNASEGESIPLSSGPSTQARLHAHPVCAVEVAPERKRGEVSLMTYSLLAKDL